jgi:hypothetical protein
MRAVGAIVALAMLFDFPLTAVVEAQTVAPSVETRGGAGPAPRNPLIADCAESVIMPSPLSERPTLKRATYASKPKAPRRHRARAKTHRVVHAKKAPVKRSARKVVRPRRPAAHRPAAHRPILHRVTYASPLCAERSTALNDMLGLPDYDITQPPIAAESLPGGSLPSFIDVPPVIGGGTGPATGGGTGPTGPGTITFPGGPIFPVGPGPIIVGPTPPVVTPPVTPPVVTPPVTPPAVPEPSSWATMLMGMLLVGYIVRRRRTAKKVA